jgi:hypothetical protein
MCLALLRAVTLLGNAMSLRTLTAAAALALPLAAPTVIAQIITPDQQRAALEVWDRLPPAVTQCLQRYGISERELGWRYGVFPTDPNPSSPINICIGATTPKPIVGSSPSSTPIVPSAPPVAHTAQFEQGRREHIAQEKWNNDLGMPGTRAHFCLGAGDDYPGCRETKVRFIDDNTLYKTQPEFRAGWNSYIPPHLVFPDLSGPAIAYKWNGNVKSGDNQPIEDGMLVP